MFFFILDHVLHFYTPNNPNNQNFGKIRKTFSIIIILHKCTINDNHRHVWFLRYGAHQTELFYFGPFFALLPPNNPNNQNFEKNEKRRLETYHFTHAHHK